jgi:hypothetical protein
MMKLKQHSSNCHELALARGAVLFSYETPVAISFDYPTKVKFTSEQLDIEAEFYGVYRTDVKYSKTTTKHINAWTATTRTLSQEVLEDLAGQILRNV